MYETFLIRENVINIICATKPINHYICGMGKKFIELTLPEWAFLDARSHLGDELKGRTVILHVRSATERMIIY